MLTEKQCSPYTNLFVLADSDFHATTYFVLDCLKKMIQYTNKVCKKMIKKYSTNLLMFILFISENDILSETTEKYIIRFFQILIKTLV